MLKQSFLYDNKGNPVSPIQKLRNNAPVKQMSGLLGNIYSYNNAGKYRSRYYTLGDTSQGIDTLSRELVVRWSREMFHQLPFIQAATTALANFSIGDAYLPQYTGTNKAWWKVAEQWLLDEWYPNCNVRGSHYDFQTTLKLESQLLDVDGDYLVVYGVEDGFPKFQLIQNNRIRSSTLDNATVTTGSYAGLIVSDGVYYTPQGKAVAYCVQNAGNLVNNVINQTADLVFSAKDAHLILDPRFVDKTRGIPAIGASILQAISIQELDSYLMEKIKIESTIALIEKTPSGEAPQELQDTLQALLNQTNGTAGVTVSPNTHAVDIVQGSQIRYVHAEGGELKSLASNSPANETQDYMTRLETQVLSTLGVPHQMLFSTDKTSGRITSAIAEMFRAAITRRQKLLDKTANFRVSWALAKAMSEGFIPKNDDENLSRVISFTHPTEFSLDAKYDSQIVIDQYQAGFSSLNSATSKLYNMTAEATLEEQKKEQIMFYTKAQEVATKTGVDLPTVISGWRYNQIVTRPPEAASTSQEVDNNP